jgi:hypothetical protein
MPEESSFEYAALESDMKRLAEQIRAGRERPAGETRTERELVKEAIRSFPVMHQQAAPVPAPAAAPEDAGDPLPDYAKNAPPEVKLEIEYLCDIALRKGISSAVIEAKKSPYFVQDAFHDALAGRLYPELQKRGLVK